MLSGEVTSTSGGARQEGSPSVMAILGELMWPPAMARSVARFAATRPPLLSPDRPWPPEQISSDLPRWWPALWRSWARRAASDLVSDATVSWRGERGRWALTLRGFG